MNHSLEIQVPNAPFNVKKNGLLDFGNVTQEAANSRKDT